jgi:hypothetical protein
MLREVDQNVRALIGAQVDGDAALAAIDAVKVARIVRIRDAWREPARVVASAGHFYLDDFGAEVREVHCAEWPGEHPAQIEDADSAQRLLIDHRPLFSAE